MTGIEHIATLYSAGWFGWAMMLLATCAVLSEVFQPGVISSVTASVFALSDRTYKQTPDNFPGQLMATLFRLGTPALLLIMAERNPMPARLLKNTKEVFFACPVKRSNMTR